MENTTTLQRERNRDIQFFSRNKQAFASMSRKVMEITGLKPLLVCLRSGHEVTVLGVGLDEQNIPPGFVPKDLTPELQRMLTNLGPGECLSLVYRDEDKTVSLYQIQVAALH